MERYSRGRLRLLEEGLQAQIAEFKADFGDKDIHTAAKLGRSVTRCIISLALSHISGIFFCSVRVYVCVQIVMHNHHYNYTKGS